jgi:type I restriction enzyme, S subunit
VTIPQRALGGLGEFRNGLNYSKGNFGHGLKVISVKDFGDRWRPDLTILDQIDPAGLRVDQSDLQSGDILFVRSNGNKDLIGRSMFIEDDLPDVSFSGFCIRFRPTATDVNPRFLSLYFRTPLFRRTLSLQGKGTNINNLNQAILERMVVPWPQKFVQKRIVDVAGSYDDLIENNRRRIALLEEAARMLYREWFVHLRFPGHEHVKIIDGLPEGWERRTLGDIAETNRASYRDKELPDHINYIDISSVTRGRIVSKNAMSSADAPGRARRRAKDGDIIWSNVRPNLRAYALILQPDEADVFSTGFTTLSAIAVPFTWLYQFVTTDKFVGHLVNHATGAGYPAVRADDFERATVMVPPAALLTHFHEATEPNFRLSAKLDLQNQKIAQARDLLLPRLMSGEIAV